MYEKANIRPFFTLSANETTTEQSLKKGFRKIKQRWAASLLLLLLSVPLLYLTWGECSGRGLSYSNLNEMRITAHFLNDLKSGDYESTFSRLELEKKKNEWLNEWFDEETLKNYESDAKEVFLSSASLLRQAGGIQDFEFLAIDKQASSYAVYYTVTVDGEEQQLELYVNDNGVEYFSGEGSFISDPLAHFGAWQEYLWQEYGGCYFDPETKEYIYDLP